MIFWFREKMEQIYSNNNSVVHFFNYREKLKKKMGLHVTISYHFYLDLQYFPTLF